MAASRPEFIDPAALLRIQSLHLRARVVVEGFLHGCHRSRHHGFSVEFSEYRPYSPGDDPRYLDWRLFARSDRYYLRRFENETNLRCHLLVDMSRSMAYGSTAVSKVDYARTAAATLACFLASQRDAVGLLTFADRVTAYLPARFRPGHLHRLMLELERAPSGAHTDLEAPMEEIARVVTKRGLIVLISDLLAPIAALETHLGYLRSRGHEVIIFRVLDPRELDFAFTDPALFSDLESGRDLYVDPAAARGDYARRFHEHSRTVAESCANLGIDCTTMTTERPLELALFDFVNARLRRGRQVLRRAAARASPEGVGPAAAVQGAAPGRRPT
jgi:uncharacterized protein (DUF58 family)